MNPTISDAQIRKIFDEEGGDLSAVAERLGIEPLDALRVTTPHQVRTTPRKLPDDIGRESLKRYRVSARHQSNTEWPSEDREVIQKARRSYDAGTHEMFQEKTQGWYILYLKPRRRRARIREYFSSMGLYL